MPGRQLLIRLIDLKLSSFTIGISFFSILLSVDHCQTEFLFVQYKDGVRIRGLNCKKELQHRTEVLLKRYINRHDVGNLRHGSQGPQINKGYSWLVDTVASRS